MSEDNRQHGIAETLDILEYAKSVLEKLAESKQDDGKIDRAEIMAAMASTSGDAARAFMGSWAIPQELQELDENEKSLLLEESLPIVLAFAKLFLPVN